MFWNLLWAWNTNINNWLLCELQSVKLLRGSNRDKSQTVPWFVYPGKWRTGRRKYGGDVISMALKCFPSNVFNSVEYLRWVLLFHAKDLEKEKFVLKILVLVLGKSCFFIWTRRRWEGIMRSLSYCGVLVWTVCCVRAHLMSHSCLSRRG